MALNWPVCLRCGSRNIHESFFMALFQVRHVLMGHLQKLIYLQVLRTTITCRQQLIPMPIFNPPPLLSPLRFWFHRIPSLVQKTVFMGQVFIWNPRTCRSLIGVSLVLMAVAPKITKQQMEKCFNFLKRSFNHVWVKLSHHTVSDFFPSYNFFERFPDGLSFSSAERTQENKLFP